MSAPRRHVVESPSVGDVVGVGSMAVAARRIRAGDVILAAGSLLLLFAILAHVAAAPATPPPRADATGSGPVSEADPSVPASPDSVLPTAPSNGMDGEPAAFLPNSRTIRSWKDLPVHVVHRPHWISRREHPKPPHGNGVDVKLRNAELHLELLGYD